MGQLFVYDRFQYSEGSSSYRHLSGILRAPELKSYQMLCSYDVSTVIWWNISRKRTENHSKDVSFVRAPTAWFYSASTAPERNSPTELVGGISSMVWLDGLIGIGRRGLTHTHIRLHHLFSQNLLLAFAKLRLVLGFRVEISAVLQEGLPNVANLSREKIGQSQRKWVDDSDMCLQTNNMQVSV